MDITLPTTILFYTLSAAIAVLGFGFLVIIVLLVLLLLNLYQALKQLRRQTEKLLVDIEGFRQKFKSSGANLASRMVQVASFFKKKKK